MTTKTHQILCRHTGEYSHTAKDPVEVWTGQVDLTEKQDCTDHSPRILDALPGTRVDIVPDRAYLASLGWAHENGRVTAAGRAAVEN